MKKLLIAAGIAIMPIICVFASTLEVKMDIPKIVGNDRDKSAMISLSQRVDNSPITPLQIEDTHTQKIHVFIIDDSLEDYYHIHPVHMDERVGSYKFDWQPKLKHNYKIWAEFRLKNRTIDEQVSSDLFMVNKSDGVIDKSIVLSQFVDEYNFDLITASKELQVASDNLVTIRVLSSNGLPFEQLEPYMGAFAHLVAFHENFVDLVHTHPLGEQPKSDTERGGHELKFHIKPSKQGFLKLFLQVKIKGKILTVPFGIFAR